MRVIGIDIGTTSICGTVLDGLTGEVLEAINLSNNSFLPTGHAWEKLQNPSVILEKAEQILSELLTKYAPVGGIGITGQMHGILYLDENGNAIRPLTIWQDGRGDLIYKDGKTYAGYLSELTSYHVATGFGLVTHFYNVVNGLVPKSAVTLCTIHDYVAMKLAGAKRPLMHVSDAASLGLFDLKSGVFDLSAIEKSGIDTGILPAVTSGFEVAGLYDGSIPVMPAIGDNQASFIGSVKDMKDSILINVGTGSQISLYSAALPEKTAMETRPLTGGAYLRAGSSLCGGRAYALLEAFFRSCIEMAGFTPNKLYPTMDKLSEGFEKLEDKLNISTLFSGTRENPSLRGLIENLSIGNFTPKHFIIGVLEGTVKELFDQYEALHLSDNQKPSVLIGSGNGIRNSAVLQKMFAQRFGMPMFVPAHKEEAAYGAALYSLVGTGFYSDIETAQKIIRYENGETI